MRRIGWTLLLLASVFLAACGSTDAAPTPGKWSIGFWVWSDFGVPPDADSAPLDSVYARAGFIQQNQWGPEKGTWSAKAFAPQFLPPAKEYWLVVRSESGVPPVSVVPALTEALAKTWPEAQADGRNVVGVQLDIDSPTARLGEYAEFLKAFRGELHRKLPNEPKLSITALLDWFRKGTEIAAVVEQTDEFVPQFYDLDGPSHRQNVIAAPFDPAKWGPVFGAFGKPYRIGLSTFGRGRFNPTDTRYGSYNRYWSNDEVTPLEIGSNSNFKLEMSRNHTGEIVLNYRAARRTEIGWQAINEGDVIQFILPTIETVRAAAEGARTLAAPFAGVVFFRWPTDGETVTMYPEEVLAAAGEGPAPPPRPPVIETKDGGCAAVHCVDVFLRRSAPAQADPVRYRIRSSVELEYFLPPDGVPIRMTGPSELELTIPPYGGRGRMILGRAVTRERAEFRVIP